ncbi:MAG TPA: PAS domain S-box protein, partial [Thermodesulfobacteriota bacterium]|nr:PAS domain S-box protein [Thermodesulfobacteriota bacterium]
SIPISSKDNVIGSLQIRSLKPNAYTETDMTLAERVSNQIAGAIANTQLLAEIKQAEELSKKEREIFFTTLRSAPYGILMVAPDDRCLYVNPKFTNITGYTFQDVPTVADWFNNAFLDSKYKERAIEKWKKDRLEGETVDRESNITCKNSQIKRLEIRVVFLEDNSVVVAFYDITERKRAEEALRQSEEKYRTILGSIEDGYYEVDLAGNFTFFNDSMCQIFGYPREELVGMNERQYTDQDTMRKLFQTFNEVYRTGKPGKVFDYEIIRKDGTKRHVETSTSLRKDASGKPIGFRGIVRDITDRKRIEEQLFQAEKLRAVGEMASGVAHDFNNALAAILGNTQILLYTAQDEELKETLKIIEKVAKDSSQTVRRLHEFTRRGIPQELSKVDINAIIKDAIEITKPKWKDEAQSRGIHIEMVSNLEDMPLASGNASELREVITNMIFNAIEAMHNGGKIEIRTFRKKKDVFIQISDTGIGITEETKKRIFEPFFTTKPFTNTGLGLSMSYGIVKRFGGEIEVQSKVGQGTTFTITLPIAEEDEKQEAVDSQPIKKGRRARILVIDDDEFVRSVLSRTLTQADHQLTLAENGAKGVQLFKQGEFDVVFTDLGMPGMSGWEVCRMIKEISPHTPVGMITGWGDERNRGKMEEYGLDFFISKPFDLAQILNVVAETMESRKE